MKLNSLKAKIILLVFSCIFLLSIASAAIAYISLTHVLNDSIVSKMNLLCEREGLETDQLFIRIEDAVGSIALFLQNGINEPQKLVEENYRKAVLKEADTLFSSIAKSTDGIVSYYVSFDPKLIDGIDGFLYSMNKKGLLEQVPLTDIRAYDPSDIEHVGWFYIPVRNGRGTWMEPYQNKNLDCYMISYVIPVFKNGTLLCIVGMDVDFKIMVDSVSRILFNKSGKAYLKSADGKIHYHEEFINGGEGHGDEILGVTENADLIGARDTEKKIVRYKLKEIDSVMAFMTLRNGMKMVLYDYYSEVYADRINAVVLIFALTALLGVVFIIIAIQIAYQITRPLENLTEVANRLSEGNLEITFPEETDDEMGVLVRGVKTTVEHLKKYTSSMETLAYQDAMTKVKNVASYKLLVENLEKQISAGTAEFAVVMCDLNYLKYINDTYGHRVGDEAIKKASRLICHSFPYSTVFRIGGDEFVIVLQGVEYESRNELFEKFAERLCSDENCLHEKTQEGNPLRVSLAYGIAVYLPSEDKTYKEVFERADAKMYSKKEEMHAARDSN